jgi:hypothetical protein
MVEEEDRMRNENNRIERVRTPVNTQVHARDSYEDAVVQ